MNSLAGLARWNAMAAPGGAASDRAAWLQTRTGGPHRVTRVTRRGGLIAQPVVKPARRSAAV